MDDQLQKLRIDLLSDFLLFTRFFFKERTGRDFIISQPIASQSHFIEIARALEDVFYGRIRFLAINCPPGFAKSELIKHFIAWTTAWYGFCQHIYISYAHELASSHTHEVKQIMTLPLYRKLFGVEIPRDSSAKDFFKTTQGGAIAAFGSSGAITGRNAGLPGLLHYSGGVIIDDIHKPDEVHSDVIREKVKKNYVDTIETRLRGENVPIIAIGHRLHQDDFFNYVLSGEDGNKWHHVNIQAEDPVGNPRYPELLSKAKLTNMKEKQRYKYYSQYMQQPVPPGGSLFLETDFTLLDEVPDILATFITSDTSETIKEWNDKTAFSFWGLYQIKNRFVNVPGLYALHWLDCREFQCEPRDLEAEFMDFWVSCMQFPVKPQCAIIEKKSTGVTLVSVLKGVQGLKVIGIDRTVKSGSKTQRFIDMQQYVASHQITLPAVAKHTNMCINHMKDITANDTHRHDDIADTAYDACNAAFIDKIITQQLASKTDYDQIAAQMMQGQKNIGNLQRRSHGFG